MYIDRPSIRMITTMSCVDVAVDVDVDVLEAEQEQEWLPSRSYQYLGTIMKPNNQAETGVGRPGGSAKYRALIGSTAYVGWAPKPSQAKPSQAQGGTRHHTRHRFRWAPKPSPSQAQAKPSQAKPSPRRRMSKEEHVTTLVIASGNVTC